MMSAADQQIADEKARAAQDQEWLRLVRQRLADWKPTAGDFTGKIRAALKSQNLEGKSHEEKREKVRQIIKLQNEISPSRINKFELLYELLTAVPGSYGPHSFKYALLADLFNLEPALQVSARIIVGLFVIQLKAINKIYRKEAVKEMARLIQNLSDADFVLALIQTTHLKSAMDKSYLNPIYTHILTLRNLTALDEVHAVKTQRKSALYAVSELLSDPLAQEGKHSYKFILVLFLLGYRIKTPLIKKAHTITHNDLHRSIEIPDDKITDASRFAYKVFAKDNRKESSLIIQDLKLELEQLKKQLDTERYKEIAHLVEKTFNGEISKEQLHNALTTIKDEKSEERKRIKDELDSQYGAPALLAFSLWTSYRRGGRSNQINTMLEDLKQPHTTVTVLDTLIGFLKYGHGSSGPHSFKYQLLKALFPTLNKSITQVTEVDSIASIELFIEIGQQRLKEQAEQGREPASLPLEDITPPQTGLSAPPKIL